MSFIRSNSEQKDPEKELIKKFATYSEWTWFHAALAHYARDEYDAGLLAMKFAEYKGKSERAPVGTRVEKK